MGLEDYIRARSNQYYPTGTRDDRILNLQPEKPQWNDQFTGANGYPSSRFMRPLPVPLMEAPPPNQLQVAQQEKSIFDTDVENVDDSTITVTSVGDIEARDYGRGRFDNDSVSQDWDESGLSESDHHVQVEDDIGTAVTAKHRRKSTIPLEPENSRENLDEYESRPYDWIPQSAAHRPSAVARDKRNSVDKSNASRIPRAKSRLSLHRSDSDPGARSRLASEREAGTRTVQLPFRSSVYSRTGNLPQSLATTPNNRFNFKTERPYERLIQQQSPTRQVSGPRPQPGSRKSTASPRKPGQARRKLELASARAVKLDMADDSSFEDEETQYDKHSDDDDKDTQGSFSSANVRSLTEDDDDKDTQRRISTSTISDKIVKHNTKFTSDYPDDILQQMDFSELEKESFDHIPMSSADRTTMPHRVQSPSPPPPPSPPSAPLPPPDTAAAASEKLDYALNALSTSTEREQYMSSMNISEWEEVGDEIIGQLGEMLKLIKESRQARRRTTALFESEIRRRHDETQNQSAKLDRKFAEMKQGGMGVLRAVNPKT